MTRILIMLGMLFCATQTLAATLPPGSVWLNSNAYLQAVKAGDRLVAVGDRGAVIYSADQGAHWTLAKTPTNVLLTDVCFTDATHGWAVGHDATIMATDNGGVSWTIQYSNPTKGDVIGELKADKQQAENDQPAWMSTGIKGTPLLGVWCDPSDDSHIVAVGSFGHFLETRDAGKSWYKAKGKLDNPKGWHLYDLESIPATRDDAFLVGEKNTILVTADDGAHWVKRQTPYEGTFFGVTATGPGNVLVFGLQGNIWMTHDYGRSWDQVESHTKSGLNSGVTTPSGDVYLVGNDGVLLTSHDRGHSFSKHVVAGRVALTSVIPLSNGTLLVTAVDGIHLMNAK